MVGVEVEDVVELEQVVNNQEVVVEVDRENVAVNQTAQIMPPFVARLVASRHEHNIYITFTCYIVGLLPN